MPLENAVLWAWHHLQLPLFMPWQAYGLNLAANQGNAWFPPELLFHLILPGNFSVWNVARLFLLAFGTYLFAEDLGVRPLGAFMAGAFMVFSGPALPNTNLGMVNPLMLLPYLLIATRRTIVAPRNTAWWLWLFVFALLVDGMFLSGFPEVLPLLFLLVVLCALVWTSTERTSMKGRIVKLFALGAASLAGGLGSIIATVPLLQTLREYFSYQSPTSYLSAVPTRWTVTLVDPSFFGHALTAGRLEMGQSLWILGNPLIWGLAFLSVGAGYQMAPSKRRLLYVFWGVVAFGVLGYSNQLNVLRLFSFPPFNLIIMIRLLSFLWWLPLCILAGVAVDQWTILSGRWRGLPWPLIIGLIVFALWRTSITMPSETPQLIQNALPSLLLLLAAEVAVLPEPRISLFLVTALAIFSLMINIPRNYFYPPAPENRIVADIQQSSPHPNASLYYFAYNHLTVTALKRGLSSVQAFGVFYPKPYAQMLAILFPSPAPTSAQGVLFAAAPTLSSIRWSTASLDRLRFLGIDQLVSPSALPRITLQPDVPAIAKEFPNNFQSMLSAIGAIAAVYNERSDLQHAFPAGPSLETSLLAWASTDGVTTDSAQSVLRPYAPLISEAYRVTNTLKSLALFNFISTLPAPHIFKANNATTFVYTINSSPSLVWAPTHIAFAAPASFWHRAARATLSLLRSTAYYNKPLDQPHLKPAHQVTVVSYAPGTQITTLKLSAGRGGLVVLRQTPVPGERLSVNHKDVQWVPVDGGVFTGVAIPRGVSIIEVNYLGPVLRVSWWISLVVSLLLLLGCIILTVYVRRDAVRHQL